MDYFTTVRVLLNPSRQPVVSVKVALFDRDENSADDVLGIGTTNGIGEVAFRYKTRDFTDGALGLADEGKIKLSGSDTTPDLYVIVYNTADEEIYSTRDQATQNFAAGHILVLLDEALAQAHQLTTEA